MTAVADQPGVGQVVEDPVAVNLVRHVRQQHALHFAEQGESLRAVGHDLLLLVQAVEGGVAVARVVLAGNVAAVCHGGERIGVHRRRAAAKHPHHQLAGARLLELLGPLADAEFEAQANRVHAALPEFVELPVQLRCLAGHLQDERRAIGVLAPAVAVAVDESVGVEQRPRMRAVIAVHLRDKARIESRGEGRHRRLRDDQSALAYVRRFGSRVVGKTDGSAQRDPLGRHAADGRIVHVEVRVDDVGVDDAIQREPAPGQRRGDLAGGRGQIDELQRDVDRVVIAFQEGQPARLAFFDDRELDRIEHGQLATAQPCRDRLRLRVVRRRLGGIELIAVAGVTFEHDARRALPRGQAKRPGADRPAHRLVGRGFHHLARDARPVARVGEGFAESRRWRRKADAEHVAVQYLEPVNRRVVVE